MPARFSQDAHTDRRVCGSYRSTRLADGTLATGVNGGQITDAYSLLLFGNLSAAALLFAEELRQALARGRVLGDGRCSG